METTDLEQLLLSLLLIKLRSELLVALRVHTDCLERECLIHAIKVVSGLSYLSNSNLGPCTFAAAPEARLEEVAGVATATKRLWHHLLQIKTEK